MLIPKDWLVRVCNDFVFALEVLLLITNLDRHLDIDSSSKQNYDTVLTKFVTYVDVLSSGMNLRPV